MTNPNEHTGQTPLEDLRRNALEHYDKVSLAAHEWLSTIPQAINEYFDRRVGAPASPVSAALARVRRDTRREVWDEAIDIMKRIQLELGGNTDGQAFAVCEDAITALEAAKEG